MELTLEAIQFNHNPAGSADSALNIRRNASTFLPVPEWRAGARTPEDSRVAYSIEDTTGQTIKIKAKFVRTLSNLSAVEVRAIPTGPQSYPDWWPAFLWQQYLAIPYYFYPYSFYLYLQNLYQYWVDLLTAPLSRFSASVNPKRIGFNANGLTALETFELSDPQLATLGVGIHPLYWKWQYRVNSGDSWQDFAESQHLIYLVLRVPTSPWQQTPFSSTNTQLPWTDVMDFACQWAGGAPDTRTAAQRVTAKVSQLGDELIEYDCPGGGNCHYASLIGSAFNCSAFLERLRGGMGNGRYVNCTDCATILSTFANALGCDLWQSRMGTLAPPAIIFFAVNQVVSIGGKAFGLPCGWPGFTYHEVAWTNACEETDDVFDACCQVNRTADPANPPRSALLPAGMPFGAPGDVQYRDRLAAPAARAICEPRPNTRVRRIVF